MALAFEVGTFALNTTTGNQTINLADTGFGTVKALELIAVPLTAAGDSGIDSFYAYGMGTYRGAAVQEHCASIFLDDAAGTSVTARVSTSSSLLRGFSAGATPTVEFDLDLVSLGDAAFTINVTDAPASAWLVIYRAYGGSDITDAMVITYQAGTNTAPYTEDVTVATGFGKPDLLIAAGTDGNSDSDSASTATIGFGYGKSDTEQFAVSLGDIDAAGSMLLDGSLEAGFLRNVLEGGGTAFPRIDADLDARANWPTDGFRLLHAVDPQGFARYGILALKGTFTSVIETQTAPTAAPTVTQDLPVGATPRGALFAHLNLAAFTGIDQTSADLGTIGLGGMDGTREVHASIGDDDAAASSVVHVHLSTTKAIRFHTPSATGTLTSEADASFSGNNVRLSWADTDSVARQYIAVLLGDAPAAAAAAWVPRAILV